MRNSTARVLLIGGLLAASAALAGCSSDSEPTAPVTVTVTATPQASAEGSATPSDAATDTATGLPLTADTAIDAALAQVPGGAAVAGGRTDEAGQQVWYVEVRASDDSGTELYFNTATGELVRQRPASLSAVASGTPPTLSAQEGLAAAVEAVPGSAVVEFDLETEKGATAWYVLVRDSSGLMEVYVNADTGAIISQERDN